MKQKVSQQENTAWVLGMIFILLFVVIDIFIILQNEKVVNVGLDKFFYEGRLNQIDLADIKIMEI